MTVEGGIDIGHQRELRRQRIAVEVGCFVEHDESREVHVGELCERDDVPAFAVIGNRAEDRFQRRHLSGLDAGDDGQCFLMWHATVRSESHSAQRLAT